MKLKRQLQTCFVLYVKTISVLTFQQNTIVCRTVKKLKNQRSLAFCSFHGTKQQRPTLILFVEVSRFYFPKKTCCGYKKGKTVQRSTFLKIFLCQSEPFTTEVEPQENESISDLEQQFPGTTLRFFINFLLEHLRLEGRWEIVVSKISLENKNFLRYISQMKDRVLHCLVRT